MTKFKRILETDFEDDAIGDSTSYPADAGDDRDGATLLADVASYGGSQQLHIKDADNTKEIKRLRSLRFTYPVGSIYTRKFTPVQSAIQLGTGVCYLQLDFYDGATLVISHRIDMNTYLIYNLDAAAYTTTGVTAVSGSNISVEFTSTTQHKIRIGTGSWSAAINNEEPITAGITKAGIQTPTAHGYEGFESYAVAASRPIGPGDARWNAWNANGNGDLSVVAGQKARFVKTNAAAWTTLPLHTFATAQPTASSGSVSCKVNFPSMPSGNQFNIYVRSATGSRLCFRVRSTGALYVISNATDTSVGVTLAINTDYTMTMTVATIDNPGDGYYLTVNGTQYGPYYTVSKRTDALVDFRIAPEAAVDCDVYIDDIVTSWATAAPDVANVEAYIDDEWGYMASSEEWLQATGWVERSENSYKLASCLSMYQADSSILTLVEDTADSTFDVYRITGDDYDTWTKVIDTGSAAGDFMATSPAAGTVYCIYKVAAGVSYITKSTDYGVNWTISASCGFLVGDLFYIGATVYCVRVEDTGVGGYTYKVYSLTNDTPTWNLEATYASGTANHRTIVHGFVTDSDYWCLIAVSNSNVLMQFDPGGGTFGTTDFISATDFTLWTRRLCIVRDPGVTWTHTSSGVAFIPAGKNSGTKKLFYTVDGGDDWTEVDAGIHVGNLDEMLTDSDQRITVDINDTNCHQVNLGTHKMYRVTAPEWGTFTSTINLAGNVILASDGTTTKAFEVSYSAAATTSPIISAELFSAIVTGAKNANRCVFKTTSANAGLYNKGDYAQFYDCWNALWFQGKIVDKVIGKGTCTFTAKDSTRELARPYNTDTDTKASTTLTQIVNALTDAYVGTIQDVNTAGDFHYHCSVQKSLQPYIRTHRVLERGVIWVTPAGQWNFDHHDDCDATGYRVKETPGVGWKLMKNATKTVDIRCTEASVRRTGNAKDSYTGNAALAATEGVSRPDELDDEAIQDSDGATSVATQLYNVFATASTFVKLIVVNHGLLQPGKTVDFSWNLGDTVIARVTLIILATHAYMLQDVQEVTLGNNILLPEEMDSLELVDEQ